MARWGRRHGRGMARALGLALLLGATVAAGIGRPVVESLFYFSTPDGYFPSGLVQASDGNFYGTTSEGASQAGSYGTVFRLTPQGVLTTLHTFTRDFDGAYPSGFTYPSGGLVQGPDGNLYGTTSAGGSRDGTTPDNAFGTVFRIGLDGTLTTLHTFSGGADDGAPMTRLTVGVDGRLYGTTPGTVFAITTAGTLTTLHTFNYNTEGNSPDGALVQGADGTFYGATAAGGASSFGAAFSITPSGAFTLLHPFVAADGGNVVGGLVLGGDGNLYGAAGGAVSNPWGLIFGMTPAGVVTVLHRFADTDGAYSFGLTAGADGKLYGGTAAGGANDGGTLFSLAQDGTLTTLYAFDPAQARHPSSQLLLAADGSFYGASGSAGDGLANPGVVYKLSTAGDFAVVHAFTTPDGVQPTAPLAQGSGGVLFGTTSSGPHGTIFQLRRSDFQQVTTLYRFDGTHGDTPRGRLLQAADGSLYGVTSGGGASNQGTVFRYAGDGTLTVLHSFSGGDGSADGSGPTGLALGPDGAYYGTTSGGGTTNFGTVFRITAAGDYSVLHTFSGVGAHGDGALPQGTLTLGPDGNFYGTAGAGSSTAWGAIYQLTPAGAVTVLHQFGSSEAYPSDTLTLGADGKLYGTTSRSGDGSGEVFTLTTAGAFTVLHSFSLAEGSAPNPLIQGSDGRFYGTTYAGANGEGTVFSIDSAGTFHLLYSFAYGGVQSEDAGYSRAALLQDASGNFYGTSQFGGVDGMGTVFEMDGPPLIPAAPTASAGDGKVTLSWTATGGAASYNVYQGKSAGGEGGTPVLSAVNGTTATVTGLDNGTAYYFKVSGVNATGESLPSGETTASPVAPAGGGGGGGAVNPLLMLGGIVAVWARRRRVSV